MPACRRSRSAICTTAQVTKSRIQKAFGRLLDETSEGDLLVFYFCGHGYRDAETGQTWFANYDAGSRDASAWNVAAVFATIEQHFRGNRALLLADCCHSGALYDQALKHRDSHIKYAALTSSYSHNTSTGNWTFSDCLLAGLRGDAEVDLNDDKIIELDELATTVNLNWRLSKNKKECSRRTTSFRARTFGVRRRRGEAWRGPAYRSRIEWQMV